MTTRLTNDPALDAEPAWSPDGSRITFISDRDENFEIHVMNAVGSGTSRVTDEAAQDVAHDWQPILAVGGIGDSPDGARYDTASVGGADAMPWFMGGVAGG